MKRPSQQLCVWHHYLAGVEGLITSRRKPQVHSTATVYSPGTSWFKAVPQVRDDAKLDLASSARSQIPESRLTSDLVECEVWGSLEPVRILTAHLLDGWSKAGREGPGWT